MKSAVTLPLILAASALAAPIGRPTPLARAPSKRQINVSVMGFTTISGADVAAFASGAGVQAVSASSSAAGAQATGDSSSSSSSSDSGSSSSSGDSSASSGSGKGDSGSSSSADSGSGSGSSSDNSGSGKDSSGSGQNLDETVLQFALVLEQMETEFYKAGLANFDKVAMEQAGLSATQADIVIQTFQEQANDEQTHQDFLKSAIKSLNSEPLNKCQFEFKSVLSNPATFISAARTIELVGVGAYAGGANLVSNPTILTDAASILSIEARHQSALNVFSGGTFAAQAFDIPLSTDSVLSLVSGFLKGCEAKDLGLTASEPLSAINAKTGNTLITGNSILAFESPVLNAKSDSSNLFCQMIVGGQPEAIVQNIGNCQVPNNINGPAMVFITNSKDPLPADVTQQNAKDIVAGPAALFIDQGTETFQQIFSIKGFGISQLASLDTGIISMNSRNQGSGDVKVIDIISESNPDASNQNQIHSGMIYGNSKRGFESFAGGRVVGWA